LDDDINMKVSLMVKWLAGDSPFSHFHQRIQGRLRAVMKGFQGFGLVVKVLGSIPTITNNIKEPF
jgi:hypothetical protein